MSVQVTGTLEPYPSSNYRVIDDTFTFLAGLGASVVVGSDIGADYPIASYQGTLHRWDMSAKVGPVGAAMIFDVLFSTNQGGTWTSLWASNPSNRPTIADGAVQGGGTAFDTSTYAQGTLWRYDAIQVGSGTAGSGVCLKLV